MTGETIETGETTTTVVSSNSSPVVAVVDSLTDNMISILVFVTVCYLWATGAEVTQILQNLVLVIAGFYYGKK